MASKILFCNTTLSNPPLLILGRGYLARKVAKLEPIEVLRYQ